MHRAPDRSAAPRHPFSACRPGGPFQRCLGLLLLGWLAAQASSAAELSWRNVAIGGGGYATGIQAHPRDPSIVVVRCDVGGLFRRGPDAWEPLLDWITPDDWNLYGVQSFAFDPQDTAGWWACLGSYAPDAGPAGIYCTDDAGATWRQVRAVRFDCNASSPRWMGECLAIDPRRSRTIWCGTPAEGLLHSDDGGATWVTVGAVPLGNIGDRADWWSHPPEGIRTVLIGGDGLADGRSRRILAAVRGQGLWWSDDGGASFAPSAGAPLRIARLAEGADGDIYATHDDGVARWRAGAWADITPAHPDRALTGHRAFCALAVDPANGRRVVVARWAVDQPAGAEEGPGHLRWYRSGDAGDTWQELSLAAGTVTEASDVPWYVGWTWFSAATCAGTFIGNDGRFAMTDWYRIWEIDDLRAEATRERPLRATTRMAGYETTCVLTLACPSAGAPLISGLADVMGFRHDDLDRFPPRFHLLGRPEGLSFDWCEAVPMQLVGVFSGDWSGNRTALYGSSDGGGSWHELPAPPWIRAGRVAMAAGEHRRLVYLPDRGPDQDGRPVVSDDGGVTWRACPTAPPGALVRSGVFTYAQPLISDRVLPSRFYLLADGQLWRSDDGLAWIRPGDQTLPIPQWPAFPQLAACPGVGDAVWCSLGPAGLWHSADGGAQFTRDPFFTEARALGFGAAAPGRTNGIAFVFGRGGADASWALWRSDDLGQHWERVSPAGGTPFGAMARQVAGDRQVSGRVYVGTSGRGIFVGEPVR